MVYGRAETVVPLCQSQTVRRSGDGGCPMGDDRTSAADELLRAVQDSGSPEPVRLAIRWLFDAAEAAGIRAGASTMAKTYAFAQAAPTEIEVKSAKIAWVYFAQHPEGPIKIGVGGGEKGTTTIHG